MSVLAQVIGILAMGANILSYQFKSKQHILLCQLVGGVLFSINMFMLGAVMGGILNIIAIIRAAVYMHKDRFQSTTGYVTAGFILLYILSYILVFTVFDKTPTLWNLLVELFPLIGAVVMTISFSMNGTKVIRVCALINSPCWLIYNSISFSLGGIACEVLSLFSAISAYVRLNTGKASKNEVTGRTA